MAPPKSEKKKKSARTKKPAVDLKKKKPLPSEKRAAKKVKKKPEKTIMKKQEDLTGAAPINQEMENARKTLLALRARVIAGISENPISASLKATADIGDVIDLAGEERDRELSLLLTDRDKEKLQAIHEALEKINDGTYGICEECGEKIGPGRIKVMPLARFCVGCQSKLEKEITLQRKAEEEFKYRGLTYSGSQEEEEA